MVFHHRCRERWHLHELWKFTVVLWNDWTGRQSSVICKQRSQWHGIGKGGAQCRVPCDFPVKSGSQIYVINVRISLLMCSGKLCCVPDLGDFCSWKCNFGVGKYETGLKLYAFRGVCHESPSLGRQGWEQGENLMLSGAHVTSPHHWEDVWVRIELELGDQGFMSLMTD